MVRRKYNTEEERKAARREASKRFYNKNKEKLLEKNKKYYHENKEYFNEYRQQNKEYFSNHREKYYSSIYGRAANLSKHYKQTDKKYNRGECTLTPQWIIDNIFSKPCHYCGETDWKLLGCDRIDNTKPHTPENVVSCCWKCNLKKHTTPYDMYMRMIGKIA